MGVFVNINSCTVLHLCAPNDVNGNPRRAFLILAQGHAIGVVDEGYMGTGALHSLWGDKIGKALSERIYEMQVTFSQYKKAMSQQKTLACQIHQSGVTWIE